MVKQVGREKQTLLEEKNRKEQNVTLGGKLHTFM